MAKSKRTSMRSNSLDPFDDRVDMLFDELELAVKWERPSILLSVYNSEFVRADIERVLNARLAEIGIKVVHLFVNENQFDVPMKLIKQPELSKTVFFISGLKWGGGRSGGNAFKALNIRREYLVDYKIRTIFWLTEEESEELPFRAPDFWAFRHRVVEFLDTPSIVFSARPDKPALTQDFSKQTEDIDKKIEAQQALLDANPGEMGKALETLSPIFNLGNLYWRKGDFAKAGETLTAAFESARVVGSVDLQFRALIGLGVVYSAAGLLTQSALAFEHASRIDPKSFIPSLYLSCVYSRLGLPRRSLFAAQKAKRLNPYSAEAWFALGNLYFERNRLADAKKAYIQSLTLEKKNPCAWQSLGDLCLRSGQLMDAIPAFEKFARLSPSSSETSIKLAFLYRNAGELQKALKNIQKVVKKTPANGSSWILLGSIQAANGNLKDAISAYSSALALAPADLLATVSLADCFQKSGEMVQFEHWYSLAEKLTPSDDEYTMACFYALKRDIHALLRCLKSALKKGRASVNWVRRDPIFMFAHDNKGFQRLI